MVYLRARFYEPEMNRFSQKDVVRGNILNTRTLNRYLYVQNDPINYYDPSGEFGLLVGTAIAAGISGLIAGGVSAYQSYKSTGSVNWSAAGKAALGGAVSAVAVGLAVATGGAAFGVAAMAMEAYVGVRTAMRGGDAASVATATAKAGSGAYIVGAVSPFIPPAGNVLIGSAGMGISGYRAVGDTRNVISVFNNPNATSLDKLNAVVDLGEDVVGFFGSAKMTVDAFRTIFSNKDFNSLCRRNKASDDTDITDPPKVTADDTPDAIKQVGEAGSNSSWFDEYGNPNWPPNGGFEGDPISEILQPGTRIDRYGYDGGTFVSPEGTPYSQRSLAPGTENKPYTVFEVVKPIEVQSGKIAPWFGEEGGGIQYKFSNPISELLEQGVLKKVVQ